MLLIDSQMVNSSCVHTCESTAKQSDKMNGKTWRTTTLDMLRNDDDLSHPC